jgi:RNA recognition motif-containing protein
MNKRLFVAGLPFAATEDEIKTQFSQAGTVVSVTIITDKFTGRSKGFGFVEMEKEEEAEKAIKTLHDTDFGGRKLVVAEAKPMEKREFTPRSGGGDDRRGGYSSGGRGGFAPRSGGNRGGGDRRGGFSRGGGRSGGY